MYNHVATWLMLIGTPERAARLHSRIDGLQPPPLDPLFGPEPRQCPLTVLYGGEISRLAYLDPALRPALDLWDTEYITTTDLRRWCLHVETGEYEGPVFDPDMLIAASKLRLANRRTFLSRVERNSDREWGRDSITSY